MEHRLTQTQTQSLVLTQKMQQALHILQLSSMELEQFVQQELETNPLLEQVRAKEELPDSKENTDIKEDEANADEAFDLDIYADRWEIRHQEGRDFSRNTDLHVRRKFYEDSITQEKSLRAHLLEQMRMTTENEILYTIGERIIIADIDERGYFTGDTKLIAEELGFTPQQVDEALFHIRNFEPTGIGACDIVECLLMQMAVEYPEEEELKVLVQDHLEKLQRRQIPKIAQAMKLTAERVEELKGLLATLNPWPGHEFLPSVPQYITPEVIVEKLEGQFLVRLVNEHTPELRVDNSYQNTLIDKNVSKEDREYIRTKLESARWLQRNITQRQETVLKVAQEIVDVQKEFLENGIEHIKPLKLQDIAAVVGVHESTVARTTRGKYIQTPQGLFELKYFFSPGLVRDSGEAQSSKSIQALMKRLIAEEDKSNPLSDQKISDTLKRQGVNVARRTVTKYREMTGVLSASMRKEY